MSIIESLWKTLEESVLPIATTCRYTGYYKPIIQQLPIIADAYEDDDGEECAGVLREFSQIEFCPRYSKQYNGWEFFAMYYKKQKFNNLDFATGFFLRTHKRFCDDWWGLPDGQASLQKAYETAGYMWIRISQRYRKTLINQYKNLQKKRAKKLTAN